MQSDQTQSRGPAAGAGDGSDPRAMAAEAAGHAQEKAEKAAEKVQEQLREQIDQRSTQAAGRISEQASDLRTVSETLRQQGKEGPAKAADQLAQYAEKVGGYLREKDSTALLNDAEDLGRRQPWAVAAGGLAVGFAASRFLKASSAQRYRGRLTVPNPSGVAPMRTPVAGNGTGSRPGPSHLDPGPVI